MPWVAITIYLSGAGGESGDPPGFVYGIFFSIFVAFNIFAINMFLQYKAIGPWRNYVFGEFVYILLSLGAKSLRLAGLRRHASTELAWPGGSPHARRPGSMPG